MKTIEELKVSTIAAIAEVISNSDDPMELANTAFDNFNLDCHIYTMDELDDAWSDMNANEILDEADNIDRTDTYLFRDVWGCWESADDYDRFDFSYRELAENCVECDDDLGNDDIHNLLEEYNKAVIEADKAKETEAQLKAQMETYKGQIAQLVSDMQSAIADYHFDKDFKEYIIEKLFSDNKNPSDEC